jgi:hypothetical protein
MIFLSTGCGRPHMPRPIASVCDTLVHIKNLIPAGFFEVRDKSLYWSASDDLYRPNLLGCLFSVSDDLQVLVLEDTWADSEMGLVYSDIFVLDGRIRTTTGYPKSGDYIVEEAGDTLFISFHYFYRGDYEVRLAYVEQQLVVLEHKARTGL